MTITSKKIDKLERLRLIVEPVLGEWKFYRDGAYGVARRGFNEQTKRPGLTFEADRQTAKAFVELLNAAPELIASAREAERLRKVLEHDWAKDLWEFLIEEFGADPDTGEVVTADIRPHFERLCVFVAERNEALTRKES